MLDALSSSCTSHSFKNLVKVFEAALLLSTDQEKKKVRYGTNQASSNTRDFKANLQSSAKGPGLEWSTDIDIFDDTQAMPSWDLRHSSAIDMGSCWFVLIIPLEVDRGATTPEAMRWAPMTAGMPSDQRL